MKILHITDSHGTVKAPESRRDVYYISFLRKLYEVGMAVKAFDVDMVLHTGDLFHTARVSDKFTGQVAELIKSIGVPFYVVPGNHDIEGYTTDTIDQTKLGLLAKTGVITILDRNNPVMFCCKHSNNEKYTVAISGQEYYAHIDEGNMKDFEMQQDERDLNILAIHGYISDTPQHPSIKHTLCEDIITDADIILSGHYHRQFEWSDGQNLDIFNPGSMMRVDQTEYNKTRVPKYGILEIGLNEHGCVTWDYSFHAFQTARPSTEVFDYNTKYKEKHDLITLEKFKDSLSNSVSHTNTKVGNIVNIIQSVCGNASVEHQVEKKAIDMYNLTLQSVPDEFEAPAGFIESFHHKKISKVNIKNFQSHEDTTVEFDGGLNIIVGESNNGKTSILRAIMWAIDNQPLGTDFIMAGKNDCEVTVEYDDGTFITRGRTLKDTGYYKIGYIDENGVMQTAEYRGFTNAIPIQIINTHQMPKVSIAKDIETHLNVVSQLDPPFLITASPVSKASAVGRITGTHVLDAGVKDCNKTIQGNKKTAKVYSDTITEKDTELHALPDVDMMEQISTAYKTILSTVETMYDTIAKIHSYQDMIKDQEDKIALWSKELQLKKSVASILTIVKNTKTKKQRCDFVNAKLRECDKYQSDIALLLELMSNNKRIVALKPIVDVALAKSKNISHIVALYEDIIKRNNEAETCCDIATVTHVCARYTKAIYTHCEILMLFIDKVVPKMQAYSFCIEAGEDAKRNLSYAKKITKAIKVVATKTKKERSLFVLQNGVCPCCGQSVSDVSHSDSIIAFFTNNDIGG